MRRTGPRRRQVAQALLAATWLPTLARAQATHPDAPRYGGMHNICADAWNPPDGIKGVRADSWKWLDPLKLEHKLRRGGMFPDRPGVMKARELVTDDVAFSFNRLWATAKRTAAHFDHLNMVPLPAACLEQVGVKVEVQAMEYPPFLAAMTTRTNAPGYLMANGHTNPLTTLRNPSQWNDPTFSKKVDEMYEVRDEARRQGLDRAWWPWVKNHGGEVRADAVRPWPV